MEVGVSFLFLLAVAIAGALTIAGLVLMMLAILRRKSKPTPDAPPVPTSLSFLAGFSFFSGLAAAALVVTAAVLFTSLSMGEVLIVHPDGRQGVKLAANIILYASVLPSVAAIAFALAARGAIAESGGMMRGRPLYRTGVLLAILSGAVVLDARVINPATWASLGISLANSMEAVHKEDLNRGYLGVETGPLGNTTPASPILRVVPGSPADRAGLKSGDLVVAVDGTNVHQLPPLGKSNDDSWSPGSMEPFLGSYIASLKPGTRVALQVRRGKETVKVVAELSASFDSLLALLQNQSFDQERLAVLKAAGPDRRYSADELLKICQTFDFDDGRLRAIETALPLLQDPQNAYRILGSLEFSDGKAKVSDWISKRTKAEKEE
jgi:hypothetical protein